MHHHRISGSIARLRWTGRILAALTISVVGCAAIRDSGCDEILSASSDSNLQSRIHHSKGVHLVEKGKILHAATAFERAIALDSANGSAHNNLGLVYFQQRKLAKAAAEFDIASQLMPDNPTPLNNLGMTLEAAGKGFEALDYYHQAHELDPLNPLYLGNFVRTRIRLEDNDDSLIAQLKELRFIEMRPDWVTWVDDQLALYRNPYLDRGPAPASLSPNKDGSGAKEQNTAPIPEEDEQLDWSEVFETYRSDASTENLDLGETVLVDPSDGMVEVELEEVIGVNPEPTLTEEP
jgi:tetratricopeptide (TPR) repeat protein